MKIEFVWPVAYSIAKFNKTQQNKYITQMKRAFYEWNKHKHRELNLKAVELVGSIA
jgi:hypothetical protein